LKSDNSTSGSSDLHRRDVTFAASPRADGVALSDVCPARPRASFARVEWIPARRSSRFPRDREVLARLEHRRGRTSCRGSSRVERARARPHRRAELVDVGGEGLRRLDRTSAILRWRVTGTRWRPASVATSDGLNVARGAGPGSSGGSSRSGGRGLALRRPARARSAPTRRAACRAARSASPRGNTIVVCGQKEVFEVHRTRRRARRDGGERRADLTWSRMRLHEGGNLPYLGSVNSPSHGVERIDQRDRWSAGATPAASDVGGSSCRRFAVGGDGPCGRGNSAKSGLSAAGLETTSLREVRTAFRHATPTPFSYEELPEM